MFHCNFAKILERSLFREMWFKRMLKNMCRELNKGTQFLKFPIIEHHQIPSDKLCKKCQQSTLSI